MSDVILFILSIIGSILLILLALLLAGLLAVLFCPVTYRIRGQKTSEDMSLEAKAVWLFGLLRIRYAYPKPGELSVKLLWLNIFHPGKEKRKHRKKTQESPEKTMREGEEPVKSEDGAEEKQSGRTAQPQTEAGETAEKTADEGAEAGVSGKISKIKYTIQKIYDRIKEIWENISYYSRLLQEDNTAKLWRHVKLRLGKIWKSVRPRHVRAEILFGAGSPDTTGYVFGIYGMLSPLLGSGVCVTPDFTQSILQGNADISGHITAIVPLWNALRLLFDRKLHLFLKGIKRKNAPAKQTGKET